MKILPQKIEGDFVSYIYDPKIFKKQETMLRKNNQLCFDDVRQIIGEEKVINELQEFKSQYDNYEWQLYLNRNNMNQDLKVEQKKVYYFSISVYEDSHLDKLFYIDNYNYIQLDFQKTNLIDLGGIFKGNFLEYEFDLRDKKLKENEVGKYLKNHIVIQKLKFKFDKLKRIYFILNVNKQEKLDSVFEDIHLSFIAINEENLVYTKYEIEEKFF